MVPAKSEWDPGLSKTTPLNSSFKILPNIKKGMWCLFQCNGDHEILLMLCYYQNIDMDSPCDLQALAAPTLHSMCCLLLQG